MTKKSIVNEIVEKLTKLGVSKNGCRNLNITLQNGDRINWVGYRQVSFAKKDKNMSNIFWTTRKPLYSKHVTLGLLNLINDNLK